MEIIKTRPPRDKSGGGYLALQAAPTQRTSLGARLAAPPIAPVIGRLGYDRDLERAKQSHSAPSTRFDDSEGETVDPTVYRTSPVAWGSDGTPTPARRGCQHRAGSSADCGLARVPNPGRPNSPARP